MRLIKQVILGLLPYLIIQTVFASEVNTGSPSVLLPGTRVVAGNLSKNEFFILGKNDEVKASKTVPTFPRIIASSNAKQSIRKSITSRPQLLSAKKIRHAIVASKQNSRKTFVFNKSRMHATVAINKQKPHRIVAIKKQKLPKIIAVKKPRQHGLSNDIEKINLALSQAQLKKSQKVKIKTALNKTKIKLVQRKKLNKLKVAVE